MSDKEGQQSVNLYHIRRCAKKMCEEPATDYLQQIIILVYYKLRNYDISRI